VRYFGLYANAHRGKVRKAQPDKHPFILIEEESARIPRRGWAEMIRKIYEVDPLVCDQCGGQMNVVAFITDYAVVDRIINHLKLTFVAERPPASSYGLAETLLGLRGSGRLFFMIFSLTRRSLFRNFECF